MHFFPQKSPWPFLVLTPQNTGCQRRFTIKIKQIKRSDMVKFLFSVHTITEAKQYAGQSQGLSQDSGSSSQVTWPGAPWCSATTDRSSTCKRAIIPSGRVSDLRLRWLHTSDACRWWCHPSESTEWSSFHLARRRSMQFCTRQQNNKYADFWDLHCLTHLVMVWLRFTGHAYVLGYWEMPCSA